MPKQSGLPQDASPTLSDRITGLQVAATLAVTFTLQSIVNLVWTLANIPSGGTSPITRDNESQFAFVASGMVWSGDAYASTRNASMTAGICYINGRRISITAVTARTFTASRDTYIDVLDNGDGTGTLVYTEATNNAASPALAANSLRIGVIVTGASNIANVGSVNQGQETKVLPIASSIAYSVTDSLGNLICPRDPTYKVLGYKQITTQPTTSSSTSAQVTGLSCPVIVPANRKVKIVVYGNIQSTLAAVSNFLDIYDGTVPSGTLVDTYQTQVAQVNGQIGAFYDILTTPASTSKTYNLGFRTSGGTLTFNNVANETAFIRVELA